MAELKELPAKGRNTPEYVAVQRSSTLIGAAIEAIRGEFVDEAHSSGLIPSRTQEDLMAVIQSEVSHNPVNYYVLQYVLATLNMGDRFKESIRSMKKVYLGEMREYIPAPSESSGTLPSADPPEVHVFISFSRTPTYGEAKDTRIEAARDLYGKLRDKGCKPWMDEEGLGFGQFLTEGIFQAIKECQIVIPIMTEGYADSLWCLRELYYTVLQEPKKTLIPMMAGKKDDIEFKKAGKWLISVGGRQKYFKEEETDKMIKKLQEELKIKKTSDDDQDPPGIG